MKTQLETLLETYDDLKYEDSLFFADIIAYMEDEALTVTPTSPVCINADAVIEDFFDQREGLINPDEKDPQQEIYAPVSGKEYISQYYKDYNEAFQSVKEAK